MKFTIMAVSETPFGGFLKLEKLCWRFSMKRIVLAIRRSVGIGEKTCYENFDAYTNFVVRAAIDVELHIPYSCFMFLYRWPSRAVFQFRRQSSANIINLSSGSKSHCPHLF